MTHRPVGSSLPSTSRWQVGQSADARASAGTRCSAGGFSCACSWARRPVGGAGDPVPRLLLPRCSCRWEQPPGAPPALPSTRGPRCVQASPPPSFSRTPCCRPSRCTQEEKETRVRGQRPWLLSGGPGTIPSLRTHTHTHALWTRPALAKGSFPHKRGGQPPTPHPLSSRLSLLSCGPRTLSARGTHMGPGGCAHQRRRELSRPGPRLRQPGSQRRTTRPEEDSPCARPLQAPHHQLPSPSAPLQLCGYRKHCCAHPQALERSLG